MNPAALAGLLGALLATALVALIVGLVGTVDPPAGPASRSGRRLRLLLGAEKVTRQARTRQQIHRGAALTAGLLVWLLSGWPVAGLIVTAAVLGLPWLLRPSNANTRRIAKLEALEEWTRRLADLLIVGAGLEQVMVASVRTVPAELAGEVGNLAARLSAGWAPTAALYAFGDDLDDVAGDLVCAALILHVADRGAGLAQVLTGLADTLADEVSMRRKVEADRARPRTTARWITLLTLGVIAFGAFNPAYLRPYGGLLGQLVLASVAAAYVGVLVWMRGMTISKPEARFLVAPDRAVAAESVSAL